MAASLLGAAVAAGLLALPAAAQSRDYAISAGRLSDVLAAYAAAAGVQLVYDPATLGRALFPARLQLPFWWQSRICRGQPSRTRR